MSKRLRVTSSNDKTKPAGDSLSRGLESHKGKVGAQFDDLSCNSIGLGLIHFRDPSDDESGAECEREKKEQGNQQYDRVPQLT